MQHRRKPEARAIAAPRPDWMPQPVVLTILLGLWTAATAIHLLRLY